MLEVCVVGFGALGSFYSFALERSCEVRVTAVGRSNYQTIKEHGLNVHSDVFGEHEAWRPYRVAASTHEAADRQYRFIVCTFKALPDVISTPDLLGVERELRSKLPTATIISGCAWIRSTIVERGRSLEQRGPEYIALGIHTPPSGKRGEESLKLLADLLLKGGVNSELQSNIVAQQWRKVLWNATYSSLCAVSRVTVRDLLVGPNLELVNTTVKEIMDEIILVARTGGISTGTLLEDEAIAIIKLTKPFDYKPSMLVDLEAGRPIEVEVVLGEIVRKAAEVGVSVPRLQVLYVALKTVQHKLLARPKL